MDEVVVFSPMEGFRMDYNTKKRTAALWYKDQPLLSFDTHAAMTDAEMAEMARHYATIAKAGMDAVWKMIEAKLTDGKIPEPEAFA